MSDSFPWQGWALDGVLEPHLNSAILQDNVFVQMLCSIQYRVVRAHADDAFYELQNPREQIQAYVFDGEHQNWFLWSSCLLLLGLVHVIIYNITNWIPLSLLNQNRKKGKKKGICVSAGIFFTWYIFILLTLSLSVPNLWFFSCPCSCSKDELGWVVWTKRWGC